MYVRSKNRVDLMHRAISLPLFSFAQLVRSYFMPRRFLFSSFIRICRTTIAAENEKFYYELETMLISTYKMACSTLNFHVSPYLSLSPSMLFYIFFSGVAATIPHDILQFSEL